MNGRDKQTKVDPPFLILLKKDLTPCDGRGLNFFIRLFLMCGNANDKILSFPV